MDIYKGYDGALRYIVDVGIGYDNMNNSVENMEKLVDELVGIAQDTLKHNGNINWINGEIE